MDLTQAQRDLVTAGGRIFLHGPAGAGKTTAAVARALHLLDLGLPAESLLILTPQRTLQSAYEEAILARGYAGGEVTFATMGGLARRTCDLFWPLVAEPAGFAHPDQPPIFLTLETAQYYMAHLVRPKLDEGMFDSVTIDRNRLYSQIIDNLNKSALAGFDYRTFGERLIAASNGDPAQRRVYADAQACANLFREYCLENNLLDFSLQLELFTNLLWNDATVREYLTGTYRHLIYDNVEEDGARIHDIVREWLPEFDSALLVYDDGGGFRAFLGADPETGEALRQQCDYEAALETSFVMSPELAQMEDMLVTAIYPSPEIREKGAAGGMRAVEGNAQPFDFILSLFYPELLDKITLQVGAEIERGISPADIVILAPYLSDALRFALMNRLTEAGIPVRSHRPSRSLRDEPASQALLTLAALAHPAWGIRLTRFDVAYALMFALHTDLVRAQLLTEIVYRTRELSLSTFAEIKPEVQERVTYALGERYTALHNWITLYRQSEPLPLDHFLRKLFGEILSQPDFGFHRNLDAARVAASLIESIQKFRNALEGTGFTDASPLGREYIAMLQDGVIAAQYVEAWRVEVNDAVLVAPAYTFLMMNHPVRIQFWLDVGSNGWVERLLQPLTHPYILRREWEPGRTWTDAEEVEAERTALVRLVAGLLRRCREHVYLGLADLGEAGFEQRGALLRSFQKVLQRLQAQ